LADAATDSLLFSLDEIRQVPPDAAESILAKQLDLAQIHEMRTPGALRNTEYPSSLGFSPITQKSPAASLTGASRIVAAEKFEIPANSH
jgi:hypothetical protein